MMQRDYKSFPSGGVFIGNAVLTDSHNAHKKAIYTFLSTVLILRALGVTQKLQAELPSIE
jgi:hypothetical protein